ncbi:MAG TPA: isoprenylcysteine carboxylmethyltransferase family protein [Xanthomonadaceae bacterium]|nr:isoprenylcysteine carboxylmethyltransferase family protein [Xanthomonadaceae bacterium]
MARYLYLLYGAACYALFLAVFLYAIGFVIGWGVPKHIDSGAAGNIGTALLVDVLLLGLFAVQHSLMARPAFKRWWTRIVPPPIERSTYVLFSSLALAALFAWWRPLPVMVWQVDAEPLRWLLYALYAGGWLLVLTGTFLISHFDLFGLRQVWLHARQRSCQDMPFVTRGYYRLVRHPLMLGFLIAFWATPDMSRGHLLFAVMTTGYILLAVKFLEERDLVEALGDDYRAYQRRVPMLLPRLWPRRKDTPDPALHKI